MNNARIEALERGLTGITKKVLDATPIAAPWSTSQIVAEMLRVGHATVDKRIVTGCLNSMLGQGLVREPYAGHFIRVATKPKLVSKEEIVEPKPPSALSVPPVPQAPAAANQPSPLLKLTEIAASLRDLAATATEIATSLEDVALDVETNFDSLRADTSKLRQLQDLLKTL